MLNFGFNNNKRLIKWGRPSAEKRLNLEDADTIIKYLGCVKDYYKFAEQLKSTTISLASR